jgi:hypothetical protein
VSVTEVLGDGGRERSVKQWVPPLPRPVTKSVCLSRSWNPYPVCPSVEVLKPRSRLSVYRGLETQISSIHLSRSWNPNLVCPSIEVLKPRSRLSVYRGPETQIPNYQSKITAQKPTWLFFSGFSWNPAVLWGFFEITRTDSSSLILNLFSNTRNLWFFDSEF